MNTLHLHLTDTASFPLEIKGQPEMTKYGAYSPTEYYSTEVMDAVVSHCHGMAIEVVPEIDTPAHAAAGWQWQ